LPVLHQIFISLLICISFSSLVFKMPIHTILHCNLRTIFCSSCGLLTFDVFWFLESHTHTHTHVSVIFRTRFIPHDLRTRFHGYSVSHEGAMKQVDTNCGTI
jgi:hypothetical protein